MELPGQHLSQPAIADDQHPGILKGDGQLLHGDLNGAFGGGYRIGYGQFFPGEVVGQGQTSVGGGLGQSGSDHAGADQLLGGEGIQNLGQWRAVGGKGGVEKLSLGGGEGKDDAVGSLCPGEAALDPGGVHPLLQSIGMYAVAILGQGMGQSGLTVVAADQPEVQGFIHRHSSILIAEPSYAAGGEKVRAERERKRV